MEIVKLGKKGQVSIPRAVLRRLGIEGEAVLLVETAPDGSIVLKPTGVYPIEIYSDQRVGEFLEEDRLTAEEASRLKRRTRRAS
ncbi:MAG: AbrB/MazE/SpoVT family DNA-binding domain-containing protein [Actinomycetota bacterium]